MKHIQIPAPTKMEGIDGEPMVLNTTGGDTMPFSEFIYSRLKDRKFGFSNEGLVAVVRITMAVKEAEKEKLKVLKLDDADCVLLQDICKNPSEGNGYTPALAFAIQPHLQAVLTATDVAVLGATPLPAKPLPTKPRSRGKRARR
jgi:hypothetical protein